MPTRRSILLIALVPFVLHLWPNPAYGYFGDELYYLACAERLAAGYVDHPPLSVWVLWAWTAVFGDSVFALRLVPSLASAALVVVSARLAQRLGGGGPAASLTGLTVALAPAYLGIFDFYSMNAFEVLSWTGIAYLVLARIQDDAPRLWVWIGVLFGLAALNKHTVVLLAAGLALGVLLTPLRRDLASRWLWLGVALAGLLFLPNLVWQVQHGWPSLEFYRNAHVDKNVDQPVSGILIGQALALGPVGLPLTLLGLASLLLRREHRDGRVFFWAYLVLLASMISSGSSRPDRIAGSYPILLAAGAVWFERATRLDQVRRRRVAANVTAIAAGLVLAPIAVASIPKSLALRYAEAMGGLLAIEQGKQAELPLWLNYRRGWEELARGVAEAAETLTPAEREGCLVYASSYGRAGAIEHFGRELGTPPVICPHNSYYHWSEGKGHADVYLTVDLARENLDVLFEQVEVAVEVTSAAGNTYPIYVVRRPRASFDQVWDQLRLYR